jgi:hypothetical protein
MNLQEEVRKYTEQIDLVFAMQDMEDLLLLNMWMKITLMNFQYAGKRIFFTVQQMLPLMKKGSSVIFNTSLLQKLPCIIFQYILLQNLRFSLY